jgi:C-terminal processing protease CtpA/Prc
MNISRTLLAALVASLSSFAADAEPDIVGIGVVLTAGPDGPCIRQLLVDSPAALANLQEGLIISAIDGVPTFDKKLDECARMIRGEKGTTVRISVRHPSSRTSSEVTVTRAKLEIPESAPNADQVPRKAPVLQLR